MWQAHIAIIKSKPLGFQYSHNIKFVNITVAVIVVGMLTRHTTDQVLLQQQQKNSQNCAVKSLHV